MVHHDSALLVYVLAFSRHHELNEAKIAKGRRMISPVRVGILGCARIAKSALIDAVRGAPELEITAVASRSLARSVAFAQEHGIATNYGAYEALIADATIEAIYNPLPNSLHAEWTIKALEAGKAVLCEKPLAANARDAQRMAEAAHASQRPLVEAFHYRHHPMMMHILELVRAKRLGRITQIQASLEIPGSLVPHDDIRFQFDLAGGAMMDVGAYCMNALRAVSEEEPDIVGATPTLIASDVDGAMKAEVLFPSGARGDISCSLVAPGLRAELHVIGETGSLRATNPFLPQLGHALEVTVDGEKTALTFDRTATYVFQARAFADVVRTGAPALTSAKDAIANMTAIDATYRAAGLSVRI